MGVNEGVILKLEEAPQVSDIELLVRFAWPEAEIGKSEHKECCLFLSPHGAHRYFYIQSPQDIREIERAVIARNLAEEYGHELLFALGMKDIYQMAANTRYIALIATATTGDRAKALVALAKKLNP